MDDKLIKAIVISILLILGTTVWLIIAAPVVEPSYSMLGGITSFGILAPYILAIFKGQVIIITYVIEAVIIVRMFKRK